MLSKKSQKYLDVEPPGADTGGHQDLNTARLEIRNGRVPAAHTHSHNIWASKQRPFGGVGVGEMFLVFCTNRPDRIQEIREMS
jgi:hypothetical protein